MNNHPSIVTLFIPAPSTSPVPYASVTISLDPQQDEVRELLLGSAPTGQPGQVAVRLPDNADRYTRALLHPDVDVQGRAGASRTIPSNAVLLRLSAGSPLLVHNVSSHSTALLGESELPQALIDLARTRASTAGKDETDSEDKVTAALLRNWPPVQRRQPAARQRFQPTLEDLMAAGMSHEQGMRLLRRAGRTTTLGYAQEAVALGKPEAITRDGVYELALLVNGAKFTMYLQVTTAVTAGTGGPVRTVAQRTNTVTTGSLFERDPVMDKLTLLLQLMQTAVDNKLFTDRPPTLTELYALALRTDPTGRTSGLLVALVAAMPILQPAHLGLAAFGLPSSGTPLWNELFAALDAQRPSENAPHVLMGAARSLERKGSSAAGDATALASGVMSQEARFSGSVIGGRNSGDSVLGVKLRDNQGLSQFGTQVEAAIEVDAIRRTDLLDILDDGFFGPSRHSDLTPTGPDRPRHLAEQLGLWSPPQPAHATGLRRGSLPGQRTAEPQTAGIRRPHRTGDPMEL